MALVSCPKNVLFQTPNNPRMTGIFSSNLVFLKCTSISCAPYKNLSTFSNPYYKLSGTTPTAEHTLYLPPTQSLKPNVFSGLIPNFLSASTLVLTAIMCFSIAFSPSLLMSHYFTVRALSMVSAVVKVLDITTTRVSS